MRKLIFVFITGIFLVSCSKKEVSSPGAANQNIFFKNVNIEVEDLKATQVSTNAVAVNFSTGYESNIKRIELMSSTSASTFCTVEGENTTVNSQTKKMYSFQDTSIKANTMYYLLRFQDNLGNWTYSDYCTVKIN